ncbi:MAG: DNA recombination protein RmuC [Oscillospiraceae bacterium]|jgi:DNA recombination protein RmuC|nr:DNA recombination protein RmuC [Oscillospiraceae bacterium]
MNAWVIVSILSACAAVGVSIALVLMVKRVREASEKLARDASSMMIEDKERQIQVITMQNESLGSGLSNIQMSLERRLGGFDLQMDRVANTLDKRLEEMRLTVSEKLDATLDRRLDASFRLVSERLEQVYLGLGEMRRLSAGVTDLTKIMSNVKTRGIWGEAQLSALLTQTLTESQYLTNVQIKKGSAERVEFAILMPGKNDEELLMPIDSKFPLTCYQRLIDSSSEGNKEMVAQSLGELDTAIRTEAKRISKYLDPPRTTEFAIMFLPVEALFLEVLRLSGTADRVLRENRVVIAGPSTLYALLTSLSMGFNTLMIEKRSHEVFRLLAAVKVEFSRYSDLLEAARGKIESAGKSIDDAVKKTRLIEKRLDDVSDASEDMRGRLLTG